MRASKLMLSTLVLTLAVTPAFAKKPATAGSDKKPDKATTNQGKKDSDHGKSGEHGKKNVDHGKDHAKNEHGRDGGPAGWEKGKKTGWGDCDAPPGQEKKAGVDCKDKKKSGGILSVFKKGDKKNEKKVDAKATTPKSAPSTTTRTTTGKTTTPSRPTRTARIGTAPVQQDTVEAVKKR
jgi:hypothetical protein